jgi:hypothetical protein
MFPAVEDELSKNPFFQAWKEKSIFLQLIGNPQPLIKEFSEDWVKSYTKKIGDGPLTPMYLSNLSEQIKCLKELDGYANIKKKLERLDEQLFPTLVEVEFIELLLQRTPKTLVKLEKTFTTNSGKNPELKIETKYGPVFLEITSIQDFKERNLILWYYNTFTAFQLSLKLLCKLNRELIINFNKYPTEEIFREIYNRINFHMNEKIKNPSYSLLFEENKEDYTVIFCKGDNVVFNIPDNILKKKIKDKIDEKTEQFDDGELNFVVIEITPMATNLDKAADLVKEYFGYTGNRIIWGVFLMSRGWTFEEFKPVYKIRCLHQPNPIIDMDKSASVVNDLFQC